MKVQTKVSQGKRGFTLVELMFSLTILLVAVVGTAGTQVSTRRLIRTSAESRIAMTDLQAVMEEILLQPLDQIPTGAFAPGQSIEAWDDRHLREQRIVAEYPDWVAGGDLPDPLEIRLQVTWSAFDGTNRRLSLSSLKTR
ncbi:MAG: type II secretion system protein [Planctomycetota bacterium]